MGTAYDLAQEIDGLVTTGERCYDQGNRARARQHLCAASLLMEKFEDILAAFSDNDVRVGRIAIIAMHVHEEICECQEETEW